MSVKKSLLYILLILSLTALLVSAACAVEYRVRDLGENDSSYTVMGISSTGEVIGMEIIDGIDYLVRVQLDGTRTRITTEEGFVRGASDNGLAVTDYGYYNNANEYTDMHNAIGMRSFARAINNLGYIAGDNDANNYIPTAFRWTPESGFESLGILPGHDKSFTKAINNLGQVVGYLSTMTSPNTAKDQAFRWTSETGMVVLDSLPSMESPQSRVQAINDLGQAVGWSTNMDFYGSAALWDADGTVHDLGGGTALDINNLGYVVGNYQNKPFLWMPDGTRINLASPNNVRGSRVWCINDSGLIAGTAYIDSGLHTIVWEPVPEPSCLMVLISGMSFAITLRRRSR